MVQLGHPQVVHIDRIRAKQIRLLDHETVECYTDDYDSRIKSFEKKNRLRFENGTLDFICIT